MTSDPQTIANVLNTLVLVCCVPLAGYLLGGAAFLIYYARQLAEFAQFFRDSQPNP